jgi:hypothetical protein
MKNYKHYTVSVPQRGIRFHTRFFAHTTNWVMFLLAGAVVYQSIQIHRLQPKIAMADMVISAVNSAPPGMGAIIHVSRQN